MKPKAARSGPVIQSSQALVAIACVALLSSANALRAQTEPAAPPAVQESTPPEPEAPKIPNDQLDSLVAPIALYPDALLAQTLAASTYPLEIIQLQQWLQKNKTLKGQALAAGRCGEYGSQYEPDPATDAREFDPPNCTTSIRDQHPVAERLPWDWRLLLNGKADELMFERQTIVTGGLAFPELKARSLIDSRAKAGDAMPNFSELIRVGLPSL